MGSHALVCQARITLAAVGGKCGLFARFTDWPRLIRSWVDRCEPGQRFKTSQKQHLRAKSSTIKSIGLLQCGGRPSNAAPSARAFETARPGGGDSSSKPSSDVLRHQIPRVGLANEGAGEIRNRAEFQANKISPARMLLFGLNSAPNSRRISRPDA
jgi:hypothetical protein